MRGKHLVACLAAVFCMGGILCGKGREGKGRKTHCTAAAGREE